MKEVSKYKTAQDLDRAEYPKPDVKIGQFYYYKVNNFDHYPSIVIGINDEFVEFFDLEDNEEFQIKKENVKKMYYAPTFLELSIQLKKTIKFTDHYMEVTGRIEGLKERTSPESDLCQFLAAMWIAKENKEQK